MDTANRVTPTRVVTPGPYRATKLWKALIRNFSTKMPQKRHTSLLGLKTYENSFTANEAVEFLHHYLIHNPNYGQSVTRDQTVMLLSKLQDQKIILPASHQETVQPFKEGSVLYKFPEKLPFSDEDSPPKARFSRPGAQPRQLFKNVAVVSPQRREPLLPSSENRENFEWKEFGQKPRNGQNFEAAPSIDLEKLKNLVLSRLICALGFDSIEEIGVDEYSVSKSDIVWNLERISKSGIVQSDSEGEAVPPTGIMQQIKHLAQYSQNKALYENDVLDIFRRIKIYFLGIREPLITHSFYDMFTSILTIIETADTTLQIATGGCLDERVLEAFQLAFLLLPPNNRRQLHILLRMMTRMVENHDQLTAILPLRTPRDSDSMRIFLVQNLWSCIIRSPIRHDLDEMIGHRFVFILLDHYDEILRPQKDHLLQQLELVSMKSRQMSTVKTFCKKMTVDQYEMQSQIPLNEMIHLLDTILKDDSVNKKEKIKRLRSFQTTYPTIYYQKFPNVELDPLQNGELASGAVTANSSSGNSKKFLLNLFK